MDRLNIIFILIILYGNIETLNAQFSLPKIKSKNIKHDLSYFINTPVLNSNFDSTWYQILDQFVHAKDTLSHIQVCKKIGSYCDARYKEANFTSGYNYYLYKYHLEKKVNNTRGMGRTLGSMGHLQYRMGNFLQAVFLSQEGKRLSLQSNDSVGYASNLYKLAWAYCKLHRVEEALELTKTYKSIQDKVSTNKNYLTRYFNTLAAIHNVKSEFTEARRMCDSAIHYACLLGDDKNYGIAISNKSNYYAEGSNENLVQRLQWIEDAIKINLAQSDEEQLGSNLVINGKLSQIKGQYEVAIEQFKRSLSHTISIGDKARMYQAYKGLATCYLKKNNKPQALAYLQKEYSLHKEIYGITEINKIFDIEKRYEEEKTKNTIQELAYSKHLAEMKARNQQQFYAIIGIALISLVVIFAIYLYRYRERENFQKRILLEESRTKISQLEKQALASQMNPHFIFNSLNAIKNFVITNDARAATQFINNFATLIRKILDFSQQNTITLAEELESLKLYMDVEQKRFSDSFKYQIYVDNDINLDKIMIPPFILQPLVENAIWHGLMHKKGDKWIEIHLYNQHDALQILIKDNGIGIERAKEIKSKFSNPNKSFGFEICRKRLFQQFGEGGTLSMKANETGGTSSIIHIANKNLFYAGSH